MRVAIVGLGSAGERHVGNLLALGCEVYGWDPDQCRSRAVADKHPGLRGLYGLPFGEAWDACVIATPFDCHLGLAKEAISGGRNVFIEKPLGMAEDLSEWRWLEFIAEDRGIVTQVGYQCRFHHVTEAMRKLAPAESGFFATACDMRTWPGKSYGPLLLEASHDLDLALHMGAPATVTEAVIDPHYVAIQLGPHWRVTLEDRADYRREWTIEQRGQSMSVTFDRQEALGDQMYLDEMAHFIECVREGRQTMCPLSEGVRVLEVAAQAEQMARKAA